MAKKTRIAVLEEFNKPLQVREMEIPDLLPGQILVQIAASGVCGSDVHMQQGQDPRLALPMSLGHEGVGQIVEMNGEKKTALGEGVKISHGSRISRKGLGKNDYRVIYPGIQIKKGSVINTNKTYDFVI